MRFTPLVPVLATATLLVACDRAPVAPDIDSPLLDVARGDEVAEYHDDFWDYVSCANDGLGEMMHWTGTIRVTISSLTTPSGNIQTKVATEYLDGYQVEGGTTGEVWTILPDKTQNIVTANRIHNGAYALNHVWLEYYGNGEGDELFVQTTLHLTRANGEVRMFRVAINACSLN